MYRNRIKHTNRALKETVKKKITVIGAEEATQALTYTYFWSKVVEVIVN